MRLFSIISSAVLASACIVNSADAAIYFARETLAHQWGAPADPVNDGPNLVRVRTTDYLVPSTTIETNDAVIVAQNEGTDIEGFTLGGISQFDRYTGADFVYAHHLEWAPVVASSLTLFDAKLTVTAYDVDAGDSDPVLISTSVSLNAETLGNLLTGDNGTTATTFSLLGSLATLTASYTNGGLTIYIDQNRDGGTIPDNGGGDRIRIVRSSLTGYYSTDPNQGPIVPEPTTLAIWSLGLGIAGLVGLRRKK